MTATRLRRPSPGRPSRRARTDDGFTLVELLVATTLSAVLLAVSLSVMSTYFNVITTVNRSYTNLDQLLPVSTSFQRLLRSAVSPDPPTAAGQPVPPFGMYAATGKVTPPAAVISPTTLTFFSNVGTPHGPAEVVAKLTGTTFTVTVADPNVTPSHPTGTCPDVSTGTHCTWGTPRHLFTVDHIANTLASNPLFTYYLAGSPLTATTQLPQAVPTATVSTTFKTCTAATCHADHIESVGVDLKVNVSTGSGQADDETVVYELSLSSQAFSPMVG